MWNRNGCFVFSVKNIEYHILRENTQQIQDNLYIYLDCLNFSYF